MVESEAEMPWSLGLNRLS